MDCQREKYKPTLCRLHFIPHLLAMHQQHLIKLDLFKIQPLHSPDQPLLRQPRKDPLDPHGIFRVPVTVIHYILCGGHVAFHAMEHHERVVDVAGTGDACCCTWDGHGCDLGCMGVGDEDVCGGGSVDGG